MGQIRKNHSADFKAQVALASIREDATIAELPSRLGIHASLIHRWKKEALAGMKDIFSGFRSSIEAEVRYLNIFSPLR